MQPWLGGSKQGLERHVPFPQSPSSFLYEPRLITDVLLERSRVPFPSPSNGLGH